MAGAAQDSRPLQALRPWRGPRALPCRWPTAPRANQRARRTRCFLPAPPTSSSTGWCSRPSSSARPTPSSSCITRCERSSTRRSPSAPLIGLDRVRVRSTPGRRVRGRRGERRRQLGRARRPGPWIDATAAGGGWPARPADARPERRDPGPARVDRPTRRGVVPRPGHRGRTRFDARDALRALQRPGVYEIEIGTQCVTCSRSPAAPRRRLPPSSSAATSAAGLLPARRRGRPSRRRPGPDRRRCRRRAGRGDPQRRLWAGGDRPGRPVPRGPVRRPVRALRVRSRRCRRRARVTRHGRSPRPPDIAPMARPDRRPRRLSPPRWRRALRA